MTDDTRLAVVEQEVLGMHDTLKEVSSELKALSRSIVQSEQQHIQQQKVSDENRIELQNHERRIAFTERQMERQAGSIAIVKWIIGIGSSAAVMAISWLLSLVLQTQSAVAVNQSKHPTIESRLQQLEARRDGP